ncbi:MAG: hypothetical protein IPG50_15470 [Myxococcales bacterium]|nr:hypothetical protein [Myxococcales bacterium]
MGKPTPGMFENMWNQLFEVWLNPELERRKAKGLPLLPPNFPEQIVAAQVILHPTEPAEIRFNEEVRAVMKTDRVGRPGPLMANEKVQVKSLQLTDLDGDCGHITLIFVAGRWQIFFDFTYYGATCAASIVAAEQFLDTAREAAERRRPRPFVHNLYTAVELLAKVSLLSVAPDQGVAKSKKHAAVIGAMHKRRKAGWVPGSHTELLTTLFDLRQKAGYDAGPFIVSDANYRQFLDTADQMLVHAKSVVRERFPPY